MNGTLTKSQGALYDDLADEIRVRQSSLAVPLIPEEVCEVLHLLIYTYAFRAGKGQDEIDT